MGDRHVKIPAGAVYGDRCPECRDTWTIEGRPASARICHNPWHNHDPGPDVEELKQRIKDAGPGTVISVDAAREYQRGPQSFEGHDRGTHGWWLERAMKVYLQREEQYGDAWRANGAMGNAYNVVRKAARCKANMVKKFGEHDDTADQYEDELIDLINYAVFTLRCLIDGNVWGR